MSNLKLKDRILIKILEIIAPLFIRLYISTLRLKKINVDDIEEKYNRKLIYGFWHGRLLAFTYTHRNRGVVVMVSQHKDGEIISRIINSLGFKTVRGSTTRGGIKAVKEMSKLGINGNTLAITPDGPKGPKRKAQIGAVILARLTKLPLIPISIGFKKKKILGSWDGFQLPYPFTKGVVIAGKELFYEANEDPEEFRCRFEDELNRITDIADNYFK